MTATFKSATHKDLKPQGKKQETKTGCLSTDGFLRSSKLGRYMSVAVVAVLLSCLFSGPGTSLANKKTTTFFLHLLTFATHFGAQCWVTFVAGFAMFFSLPRIFFGHLQSRLFPVYFTLTLVLSCVTLFTYVIRHPWDSMTSSETKQFVVLCTCVISTFVNSFFLAPGIVDAMIHVFEMEKDSGAAYVVGYCDRTELKKDPVYLSHYKRFRLNHSLSGLANVLTLICNVIYLYHLACLFLTLEAKDTYCL